MNVINRRTMLGAAMAATGLVPAVRAAEQPKGAAAPGQPLNITVATAAPGPDATLAMGGRSSKVAPLRSGCTHTGGGNVDVQQPSPDVIVVTMSGVAVAYGGPTGAAAASLVFDLCQQFEVVFDKPSVKAAKLTVEGRLIGFLRSHKLGAADVCASASVSATPSWPGLVLSMPGHAVAAHQSLAVNDREAPDGVAVTPGKYVLNQSFKVSASMPKSVLPCKGPSAEFAPDPALDPLWIGAKEPFHGAKKADLGFQVIVRVVPESK